MKLVKPEFQIIEPTGYTIDDIYKSIELAGRCSHKSEDKITETSAKDFVGRMLNMKHLATCEFGTVYLYYKVDKPSTMVKEIIDFYKNNQYSKVECVNNYSDTYLKCGMGRVYNIESEYFITTSLRVCLENNRKEYLTNALCEPTEYHHKRYTVKFILDRGILAEFTRHRTFSFMAESSRYNNYSKDKFNNEITYILPSWCNYEEGDYGTVSNPKRKNVGNQDGVFYEFVQSLLESEHRYFNLLRDGWKPEQARNVLPLSLKTELYMCGFAEDWKKFFELRCAPNAHPQAKELAIPLKEEFIKRGYINE